MGNLKKEKSFSSIVIHVGHFFIFVLFLQSAPWEVAEITYLSSP